MTLAAYEEALGPAILGALEKKGFASLTPVQAAVLSPELVGRDLRVTSQTGSGKTVAIGLAIRVSLEGDVQAGPGGVARPRALVVAPTRELAKQVEDELRWLFAPLGARVASTTGGASFSDERRMLAAGPAVVVGTPGRMLDYLNRKGIDASQVQAIVLDEADRMLDLGFRDELEAIMKFAPEGRRTHLVSATFPRDVQALANRVQKNPAHVEGTQLGKANSDIDHVVHLVENGDRIGAIINVLLANPDDQTLIFAKMRAEVAEISNELRRAGFGVSSISGELDQKERTRALAAFRNGSLRVLVATDVAARGIDVQDIARVIHVDAPNDPDSYTHRSGRTGRAGRKGTSAILAPVPALNRIRLLLGRAGVTYRIEPLPTADAIRRAADVRLFDELIAEEPEGFAGHSDRVWSLAKRLADAPGTDRILARLLLKLGFSTKTEPRDIRVVDLSQSRGPMRGSPGSFDPRNDRNPREARQNGPRGTGNFVPFRVTWGTQHGADTRRLVAMACRRGGIRGTDLGAIRVERTFSLIEVDASVAQSFAQAASAPDPRDPRVTFERDGGPGRANSRDPYQGAGAGGYQGNGANGYQGGGRSGGNYGNNQDSDQPRAEYTGGRNDAAAGPSAGPSTGSGAGSEAPWSTIPKVPKKAWGGASDHQTPRGEPSVRDLLAAQSIAPRIEEARIEEAREAAHHDDAHDDAHDDSSHNGSSHDGPSHDGPSQAESKAHASAADHEWKRPEPSAHNVVAERSVPADRPSRARKKPESDRESAAADSVPAETKKVRAPRADKSGPTLEISHVEAPSESVESARKSPKAEVSDKPKRKDGQGFVRDGAAGRGVRSSDPDQAAPAFRGDAPRPWSPKGAPTSNDRGGDRGGFQGRPNDGAPKGPGGKSWGPRPDSGPRPDNGPRYGGAPAGNGGGADRGGADRGPARGPAREGGGGSSYGGDRRPPRGGPSGSGAGSQRPAGPPQGAAYGAGTDRPKKTWGAPTPGQGQNQGQGGNSGDSNRGGSAPPKRGRRP